MTTVEKVLLENLALAAHRAYSRGIQTGSGGNLSSRVGDNLMLVKSSGGSFADCDATGNGFVLTDLDGEVQKGFPGKPTREVFLHGLMYKLRPDVSGIIHSHSPWAITWSFTKKELPMITQHLKLKFKSPIPVIDIDSPMVRPEDEEQITELFRKTSRLPAFILVGHGVVALGKDALEAEHNAELVEETAQIAVLHALMMRNTA